MVTLQGLLIRRNLGQQADSVQHIVCVRYWAKMVLDSMPPRCCLALRRCQLYELDRATCSRSRSLLIPGAANYLGGIYSALQHGKVEAIYLPLIPFCTLCPKLSWILLETLHNAYPRSVTREPLRSP